MAATSNLAPAGFLAVAVGAVAGAWLRWGLALWLNSRADQLPWGTLVANLAGGYLIGVILGLVSAHPEWPHWMRLMLVTGFLGALTTFSTFSAETVGLLQAGRPTSALGYTAFNLFGSLVLTVAGLATVGVARAA